MPTQKIREHFLKNVRLVRIYHEAMFDDHYGVLRLVGQRATIAKDFDNIPVGSYVVNLDYGDYNAWVKTSDRADSHRNMWRAMPQWKADLLGLVCFPFLPDDSQ